ncbi:MAG TPA: hypothetical protein K8W18_02455, partial [Corynebacterium glutamicum]|nr:hypothetical protein [Corynebacterium glutamicum]
MSVVADPSDAQNLTVTLDLDGDVNTNYIYHLEYITCTADGNLLQTVSDTDDTYTNAIVIGDKKYGSGIGNYTGWE